MPGILPRAGALVLLACAPLAGDTLESALASEAMARLEPAAASADDDPPITVRVVAVEPDRKFPKSLWTFDVGLENRGSEALWFLIPEPPERGFRLDHGAHALELVALGTEASTVKLLRISATHDLLAFRLAAGARLALRGLKLASWAEEPLERIEVWSAREILLDGRPLDAERLGGTDPLQVGQADVDATVSHQLYSWADPDFSPHPLAFPPSERWSLAVELGDLRPPWSGL